MEQDNLLNSALVSALRNIFGEVMAERMLQYLEQENAIEATGTINLEKLEPALRSMFGQGCLPIMHSLFVVRKNSFSKALR